MKTCASARVGPVLFAVALMGYSPRAHAADAPSDMVLAEGLFDEGRKLLEEGKYDEACAKLDASNRLDSAVGTLLNLGDCNERRGRFASAWSNYRAATSLALTRGDSARAEFARKRGEAIQPRFPMLTVVVATPEPGLNITCDGVQVHEAAFNTALPMDAGTHVIEARAPGKAMQSTKVTLASGNHSVTVGPLASEVESTEVRVVAPAAHPSRLAVDSEESRTVRSIGLVTLGVGGVALGVGAYFALHARSVWSDAKSNCDSSNRCDDTGFTLNHEARNSGDVATIAFSVGLVLAAVGTLCVLLAPRKVATLPMATLPVPTLARASTKFALRGDGARMAFDLP